MARQPLSIMSVRLPQQPDLTRQLAAVALLSTLSLWSGVVGGQQVVAQEQTSIKSLQEPSNAPGLPNRLQAEVQKAKTLPSPGLRAVLNKKLTPGLVSSKTPSAMQSSIPSLWWISDQLAALEQYGNKLIQEWVAYPGRDGQAGRVELLVNRQEWSLLNYFQRYEFVHKFSAIARGFGYNTRVYNNPDKVPVALYTCDFSPMGAMLRQSPQYQYAPSTSSLADASADLANSLTCHLNLTGFANRLL